MTAQLQRVADKAFRLGLLIGFGVGNLFAISLWVAIR